MHSRSITPIRSALVFAVGLAIFSGQAFCGQPARKGPPSTADQIVEAKEKAVKRFRNLRKPSKWRKLLARDLGPMHFRKAPTADAARAVAKKLGLKLDVATGIEGTVTYKKTGSLKDFTREGLNPRYWYLSLEGGKLHLKPFVTSVVATVSSRRGQYYQLHAQELAAVTAKCGARKEYGERLTIDGAGAVSIRGRVWFIDKVKSELKIKD